MPTVKCYGIHSDEVGLRYLVQDTVTNAYGFSRQESFHVETPFRTRKAPMLSRLLPTRRVLNIELRGWQALSHLPKKGISQPQMKI